MVGADRDEHVSRRDQTAETASRRRTARRPRSRRSPSPAADEVSTGFSDDVQGALSTLSEEFRTAVVLCDVVGLPYEEISVSTGVPVGTVRSRIHRGRKLLRTALAGPDVP
ncbi:MAG: hypothetical protein M5U31_02100 [Acidimicrobiia bacterium]|nr:hypothetical protein [Acidimicrobiia bacterium]